MTINSASTFNDYILDVVGVINATLGPQIPNWVDIKVIFEVLHEDYPMVSLDYFQVMSWSAKRKQYYDALLMHVKVLQNNDWLARKILQELDLALGFAKNSVLHRQLVETLDVNALSFNQLEAGTSPNVLPDFVEVVGDEKGWTEAGTENMRHYYRNMQIFYHK
jgi:hypothetical protein